MNGLMDLAGQPVIVGSGLGGLLTALELAPRRCVLVTRAPLGTEGSSGWAQGGIAVAVGEDDSPALHLADTLAAGDGLCDAAVAARITAAGPAVMDVLAHHGVRFDRAPDGRLAVGLEAAHARRRIVHAAGDATGAEIVRALREAVLACPSVTVLEHTKLSSLLTGEGRIVGVVLDRDGERAALATGRVVLATGGLGALFRDTTNPMGATGSGLAAAARAGARLGDLEFVQFHPTALAVPGSVADAPMKLVSEAVRGEGATLIDETGARFMENELAPRDVVSRAVWHHLGAGHAVFLDARTALGSGFERRFPGITAACRARGVDPATMPIPVRPAAHYHMGGVAVDADGRSSVPGLYACGEVACTGLHGANRLASNSLLEAAVGAVAVAAAIASDHGRGAAATPRAPASARAARPGTLALVRQSMARSAGVLRDEAGLDAAIGALAPLADGDDAALVALLLCLSARERRESRGGHFRTDHPDRAAEAARRTITLDEAMAGLRSVPGMLPERRLAS